MTGMPGPGTVPDGVRSLAVIEIRRCCGALCLCDRLTCASCKTPDLFRRIPRRAGVAIDRTVANQCLDASMFELTLPNPSDKNHDTHRRTASEVADEDDGDGNAGYRLRRLRDAAMRLKWIVAVVVLAGILGGIGATKLVTPLYEVETTVYLGAKQTEGQRQGPIQEREFVADEGLVELLKSYRVLEPVVVKQRMHIWIGDTPVGKAAFDRLATTSDVQDGTYRIEILPGDGSYRLYQDAGEAPIAEGSLPDSVGRAFGLIWRLDPGELPAGGHTFGVRPVRDAARALGQRIGTSLPQGGQILTLTMSDISATRGAQTLNAVVDEFLTVTRELQHTQTGEYSVALREQLRVAATRLRAAEQVLQSVRSANITRPSQASDGSVGPIVSEFFSKRARLDELRRDRMSLEQLVQAGSAASVEGLLAMPTVSQANTPLGDALQELGRKEAQLRAARQQYSDEFVSVRDLVTQVATLRQGTIPRLARLKLEELKFKERDLEQSVTTTSGELRKSPGRGLDEVRAKREFDIADQFYTSLLSRSNEVRLASKGSTEEIKVIDRALPPATPTSNSKRTVLASGLFAGLALAGLLVLLTDRLDARLRYPEQIEKDLRLRLIARIPMLPTSLKRDAELLIAAQAMEAFRSVRLRLQQEFEGRGQVMIVVTSEGVHEGKSLISANLAATFAEAGVRTLLVDGDLRRGGQHIAYGVPLSPGFTDVLSGRATLQGSVRRTESEHLCILPAGARSRRVPELLDRETLMRLLHEMKSEFEVVIIDSAPLGAGVDTYALGTAAGAMLMVLRHGTTNRKAADARLAALDPLPVRIIGAILNGVPATKAFASYDDAYSYLGDYALVGGDAPQPLLPKSVP